LPDFRDAVREYIRAPPPHKNKCLEFLLDKYADDEDICGFLQLHLVPNLDKHDSMMKKEHVMETNDKLHELQM
jgi:hypothetical protein